MSHDHTAISITLDPKHQAMEGTTYHGNMDFRVPYVTQITQTLWMGGCRRGLVAPEEIKHIFSLYPWEEYERFPHQSYTSVQMHDSSDQDLSQVLEIADRVIEAQKSGPVLVHCQAGLNRSGLVVATVLVKSGALPAVAIRRLRELRSPAVLCNAAFEQFVLGLA